MAVSYTHLGLERLRALTNLCLHLGDALHLRIDVYKRQAWNLIVGAGSVWDQAGDNGYTRASLPFALIERSQNCVHNGELTFLFSNTQQPSISQVRYQITQETCYYMKVDMWGQVPAHYTRCV